VLVSLRFALSSFVRWNNLRALESYSGVIIAVVDQKTFKMCISVAKKWLELC